MLDIHFNYKKIKNNNLNLLCKSIYNNYNINEFTLENPFYYLFKRDYYDNVIFNNKYQLIQLLKKKKRIGTNGRIFYGKLIHNKKYKYDYIFIKESFIIPYNKLYEFIKYKNNNNLITDNEIFKIPHLINSMNNPSYIHNFISYLLSKCVENNYILHFPLFYGSSNVIMDKFTYPMERDTFESLENDLENLDNLDDIKLYCYEDEYFLEIQNVPVVLTYHENIKYNFIKLLINHNLSDDEWYSFLFQIYFSLYFIQSHFNMIHNDLHIGNIMYKKTNQEYIYYYFNNRYYKIPTFNRIYIIIDWERSTFEFNGNFYYNNVYLSHNDCSGQYYYNSYHSTNKNIKLPNKSFDITFLITSILNFYEEEDISISNEIFNYFINLLIDKNGKIINYNIQSFNLYEMISNNSIYGIPKNRLNDSIFKKFKVYKKDIGNNKIYY